MPTSDADGPNCTANSVNAPVIVANPLCVGVPPAGIVPLMSLSSIHAGPSATYSTAKEPNSAAGGGASVSSSSVRDGSEAALLEIAPSAKPSTMSDPVNRGLGSVRGIELPLPTSASSSAARGSQRMSLLISLGRWAATRADRLAPSRSPAKSTLVAPVISLSSSIAVSTSSHQPFKVSLAGVAVGVASSEVVEPQHMKTGSHQASRQLPHSTISKDLLVTHWMAEQHGLHLAEICLSRFIVAEEAPLAATKVKRSHRAHVLA